MSFISDGLRDNDPNMGLGVGFSTESTSGSSYTNLQSRKIQRQETTL